MNGWKAVARALLVAGHLLNRILLRPLRSLAFGRKPAFVVPYVGHVIRGRLLLRGRVLRGTARPGSAPTDSRWRNLVNSYRLFATHEVAGARVRASFGGLDAEAVTGEDGYFDVDAAPASSEAAAPWQSARVELLSPRPQHVPAVEAPVLVHPMTARFGVISDIDDTVVATHVTSAPRMLATVLLSNAHTRLPFDGIAALYRALERGIVPGEHNPIFYVSNGPWNLHEPMVEFFRLNDIPLGPIHLRDFGHHVLLSSEPRGRHKRDAIERILADFAGLPFVLIGDSGEHDPEIYVDVALRHPGRIRAIYIRCVHRDESRAVEMERLAASLGGGGTHFVMAADTESAALDAVAQGLIAAPGLAGVRTEIAAPGR